MFVFANYLLIFLLTFDRDRNVRYHFYIFHI